MDPHFDVTTEKSQKKWKYGGNVGTPGNVSIYPEAGRGRHENIPVVFALGNILLVGLMEPPLYVHSVLLNPWADALTQKNNLCSNL